jgi:hypothetical protein
MGNHRGWSETEKRVGSGLLLIPILEASVLKANRCVVTTHLEHRLERFLTIDGDDFGCGQSLPSTSRGCFDLFEG